MQQELDTLIQQATY